MHWNLLGEGATGKTRVGYVWMEFRRLADDGTERWFGCGARLQASVHTTGVHADYFTTGARIAHPGGVLLVNEAGQPLTRAALAEALRDRGDVHASATDHRTAVRRALFAGMGEQRYESLLSALLQLRQPKLSERLDPSLLSTLLSRALPPLGEGEIAELAEGFERLDRQREHLETARRRGGGGRDRRRPAARLRATGPARRFGRADLGHHRDGRPHPRRPAERRGARTGPDATRVGPDPARGTGAARTRPGGDRRGPAGERRLPAGRGTGPAPPPRREDGSRRRTSCAPPPRPLGPRRRRTGGTPTRRRAAPAPSTSTRARPPRKHAGRPGRRAWSPSTTRRTRSCARTPR